MARRVHWARVGVVLLAAACAALARTALEQRARIAALEASLASLDVALVYEVQDGARWRVVDYELSSGCRRVTLEVP